MKFIIEGKLDSSGKVEQDNSMFNACAIIGDQLVGQTQVSTDGEYKLEFQADTKPDAVDVKILPVSIKPEEAGKMALSKRISGSEFSTVEGKTDAFRLSGRFYLPIAYLDFIRIRTGKYQVHGTVYLEHPTYFSTLPGCRVDFYEVDFKEDSTFPGPLFDPDRFSILRRRDFLGSAYTRTDGSYEFDFKFGAFAKPISQRPKNDSHLIDISPLAPIESVKPSSFIDYQPDIQARFYLYINGVWTHIHTAPMVDFDWNIGHDYHRDYRIPADVAAGVVEPGDKPATGFRFKTIGLIPIDTTRIVDGYIHSQPGDPLSDISHEPLCGVLRIYGLFAPAPVVTTYTVETLKTDATGTALTGEDWTPLGSTFGNLQWNDTTHKWDSASINQPGGRYRNVDIEDPMEWLEPSLKAVWNTGGVVDGYYILRLTGYDAADNEVITTEMPMVRIYNEMPQGAIDVLSPSATVCGDLALDSTRTITFRITAYDPDGHVHSYSLTGSRGRYAESAGAPVSHGRPVADANWEGVPNGSEPFVVSVRSSTTMMCATMAYHFRLCVQGAGTDGKAHHLESKRVWRTTNLIVTE